MANVKSQNVSVFTFDTIGRSIESLVYSFYENKFDEQPFEDLSIEKAQFILAQTVNMNFKKRALKYLLVFVFIKKKDEYGKVRSNTDGSAMNGKHPFNSIIDMESTFDNPEHELFMLSVLLGRFEMAKIFCFNGRVILDVSLLFN